MNYFEEEVERYKRRIERIKANPSPTMLWSNVKFYELMLKHYQTMIEEWREGKPFCACADLAPYRLIKAMGIRPFSWEMQGDYLPRKLVPEYFRRVRATGFPDNGCDRVQATASILMATEKGEVPMPSCVVVTKADCNGLAEAIIWGGRQLRVPTYVIDCPLASDVPYEERWEALKYMEEQLYDMIGFLEKEVPGAKYDEAKLIEYLHGFRKVMEQHDRMREASKSKPCPLSGKDSFRMAPLDMIEEPELIEYYVMVADEMEEKSKAGRGASVREEKARVGFLCSAPFFIDGFQYLEECGVGVPIYEAGSGAIDFPRIDDESTWGRKLSPIELEGAYALADPWHGVWWHRWRAVRKFCQEVELDGLVHFELPGCETCNGSTKLIAKMAEKELGIANLEIEGWCHDQEKFNEAEYAEKMRDFAALLFERKKSKIKEDTR